MEFAHAHIGFNDLSAAIEWMQNIWQQKPTFQNPTMAVFTFKDTDLVFDKSEDDSVITLAFNSLNCDKDFDEVSARGGIVIQPPIDQPWGVRAAFIQGPGKTTIEIEQALK